MKNIINYDLKKFKTEHFKGFPKKLIRPLHFTNRNEYYDFKKVIFICIYFLWRSTLLHTSGETKENIHCLQILKPRGVTKSLTQLVEK